MNVRRIWIAALTALVAFASYPTNAHTQDDAGGRSIFAFGAGNRALSMGGAYTAIASDASSPLWNPGGIGIAIRRQLEASQTGYYGLGINEQYASFVLPSWRWGTVSTTFRHYGVSGIEERDDRNVLLSDDLSNHQTEFSIGYGKSINNAWSLGAVIKLQNHSLAGFSGSGIGVDVGVIAKPLHMLTPNNRNANRFTLGVALRNVVEPKIRLADEKVPDPIGVRVGTAFMLPVFNSRNVLLALDVEKTSQMDTRLHAGMELPINNILSLRTGVDNGVFTTGATIAWRDLDVSYVFEDTKLGGVNRVGISVAFGPTVFESRQAALDVEEEKLQRSLTAAFADRQQQRVGELLAQAATAQKEGRINEALSTIAVVDALEPGNQRSKLINIELLRQQAKGHEANGDYAQAIVTYSRVLRLSPDDPAAAAGYQRAGRASDSQAKRSAEIRKHYEGALRAFSVQKLTEARDGFEQVIRMSATDREASVMLDRTREAIDHRCDERLNDAIRFTEWGYFTETRSTLAEVQRLNPRAKGLAKAQERLRRAEASKALETHQISTIETVISSGDSTTVDGQATTPGGQRLLSDKDRREIERLYENGTEALAAGRNDEAINYLELVWSKNPHHQRVREHLKREYLTRGMEYFADGDFDKAEEIWEKALRIDPKDERILGYLARAREQLERTRQILGRDQ